MEIYLKYNNITYEKDPYTVNQFGVDIQYLIGNENYIIIETLEDGDCLLVKSKYNKPTQFDIPAFDISTVVDDYLTKYKFVLSTEQLYNNIEMYKKYYQHAENNSAILLIKNIKYRTTSKILNKETFFVEVNPSELSQKTLSILKAVAYETVSISIPKTDDLFKKYPNAEYIFDASFNTSKINPMFADLFNVEEYNRMLAELTPFLYQKRIDKINTLITD